MPKMRYITLSILLIFIISCKDDFQKRSFYKMGTLVELTLPLKNEILVKEINVIMDAKEANIITLQQEINSLPITQTLKLDNENQYILTKAAYFWKLSEGRFDITTAAITSAYGFPEGPYKIPDNHTLQSLKESVGFNHIKIKENKLTKSTNLKIDTGAYTKGYIVDKVVEHIKTKDFKNGLINAGGDLYALGTKNGKKWKIAIKNPDNSNNYLSIVNLSDVALATSGNYERYFTKDEKRITHIFDGLTGESANYYQSVSVISKSVEISDGLATVYYLSNLNTIKKLCKTLKTPVLIYTLDNNLVKLCGWEAYEKNH